MRLLILSQYFYPEIGAPQTRLAALAEELLRRGHQVEVVTAFPNYPAGRISAPYRGSVYRREMWNGIPIHRLWVYASLGRGFQRLLNYLSFTVTCLYGLLRARKPDYIFVESPPLFLGISAWIISRLRGVPFLFNVSDLWPDSVCELGFMRRGMLVRCAEYLEAWTYRNAYAVVAVTEGIRRTLIEAKKVPAAKVHFLPNAVDSELFRPLPPDVLLKCQLGLEGRDVVLFQGSLGYAQDLENVLRAASILQDTSNIHFLFVGDGSARGSLEKFANQLKLRNVTFHDPVPKEELPRFFSISRCGLVTLRDIPLFDGARPSKALAVMACAKPLLYVARGEGAKLVIDANCGVLVPPGNPEALALAARNLIDAPELASRMGQNGRDYVQAHMTWARVVEDWLLELKVAPPSLAARARAA